MIDRIGFTLISTAIAVTMIAFARNKTHDLHTDLFTTDSLGPYNTSRRAVASLYEQDSVDRDSVFVSVADPLVIQAAEAVRNAFNAQRTASCASLGYFNARGATQYAKKAYESNGTTLYTLEIVFGDSAVFARVALQPKSSGTRFQLIFSIPGPCEDGVREQLAVSALGALIHAPPAMPNAYPDAINYSLLSQSSTKSTRRICPGPPRSTQPTKECRSSGSASD
jgi:hypothetical protein